MILKVLARTANAVRVSACFGAKKKKEAESQMLTGDIVNIFKDREDPEPKPLEELPLFVHQCFFSSMLGGWRTQSVLEQRPEYSSVEAVDQRRVLKNVRRKDKKLRAIYVQMVKGKKGFKHDFNKAEPLQYFNVYDVFSDRFDQMKQEEDEERKRAEEEAENEEG